MREMKLRWEDEAESDPNISMKVSVRSCLELRLSGKPISKAGRADGIRCDEAYTERKVTIYTVGGVNQVSGAAY